MLKNRLFRIIFLAACAVICHTPLSASSTITTDVASLNITPRMEFFEDKTGTLTVEDIISNDQGEDFWKKLKTETLTFGFSDSTYWFCLNVKNTRRQEVVRYIEFKWATLDYLFLYNDKGRLLQKSGDRIPYADWSVQQIFPSFRIALKGGEEKKYYIRLKSASIMKAPVFLKSSQSYQESIILYAAVIFFIAGILFSFVVYNGVMFLQSRDLSYVLLVAAIIFLSLAGFIGYGGAYGFLWPSSPSFQNNAQTFFYSLGSLANFLFIIRILALKKHYPLLSKAILAISILLMFFSIISLTPVTQFIKTELLSLTTLAGILFILWSIILSYKKIPETSFYIIAGWTIVILSVILNICFHIGLLNYNFFIINGPVLMMPLFYFFFSISVSVNLKEMHHTIKTITMEKTELMKKLEDLTEGDDRDYQYNRTYINNINVTDTLKNIRTYLEREKMYLDENLTPEMFCSGLNINTYQLSEILNKELDTSFPKLINEYRVMASQVLLRQQLDKTILNVAYESGFSSKATFNREFKKITGLTPSQFREEAPR